ncbi:preprotein translocase subunit SecA [Candidatus Nomurabacteria bacterium RIFCSPLOWO2_01_FULL_42_20]|uniref:Protein translocase subunit SecA n=1 Tax=Candidatus Nomurabacteria bacterium RIFCSPHIGHO2_01_FULL_42_16 TaxID=1801743 RepID=A0A1F6VHD0_9BACT|nr:MAG: preprotein translocase subunit SecA [Candidatus Nomurabacteria bacterium RIFCSPHIGHO2_01_FULL_42_16]OGI91176.1 MAG: preprotein translocase subunit SecA [Candidatus Nomurabacteria bacterium RIFCSPLOWO2_01_FULL_42_20]
MANFLTKIFSGSDSSFLNKVKPTISKINFLEGEFEKLSLEDFPKKTSLLQERLKNGETLDDILPEAFAAAREAAKRTLGQRHYDVQLIGGIVLHERKIAEMKTGEGKTLVATLPVYLNALTGRGVHVVTVNDYLSRRDAVWMGQIYNLLGLSVGVINDLNASYLYDPAHQEKDKERDQVAAFKVVYEFLRPCSRKEAYAADITYGTNHQFGFDYLRDNLAASLENVVQREHHYAIVDEVDSILIDESRTPLIISSEREESEDLYKKFTQISGALEKETHYAVDEKLRAITLNDAGIMRAEEILGISNIYTEKGIKYVHHLETAVRAKALFQRDKDYVVKDGEIIIVDPFTGRLQPGRRWSEGLHQAIEAKEGVKIQKETKAVASITFQNYFRMYEKIAGMTGTAKTSEEEFFKVYNLPVISVPTNKPMARADNNDLIFQTEKGKWAAIVRKVEELQKAGQPALIGTVSIERNEMLSAYLTQAGVRHTVLNAKNHEREGEIIAEAGKKGAVTIATNMAGRGVDIKLGGPLATEALAEEIKSAGGLFVIGTERHEARRIDNQLRGRAGRQGDRGGTQFYVSLEDELMRVFGGEGLKKMMGRFGIPEDQPIENRFVSRAIESAQEKIEGFHFDARKYTLEYDNVMNHQRGIVYGRRRKMLEGDKAEAERILKAFLSDDEENTKIIEEKKKAVGAKIFFELVRRIILHVNDILWTEHIETMEYLRSSVNLRAYGQRDPLVEYKKEGLRLFRELEVSLREQVLELIKTIDVKAVPKIEKEEVKEIHKEQGQFADQKVGRNDPCPCNSGKKYKKCHGK